MSARMPGNAAPERPDPDALLTRVQEDEKRAGRGRLKIFFGAAAGVGKSYAMLEDARRRAAEGVDVVVGYVELHGRPDTEALLDGLEILPAQRIEHRGVGLREFDLDGALARHPGLAVVDELAHTNVPGARHPKRWQDVEEMLQVGIDVCTTINVQHLESLNDVVAQITGVQVRETIPDGVFERADEVELIDLPPDDLLERLREGKVYGGEKSGQALREFFRKGNLIALRQLALRATADRVDAAMREYRDRHAIASPWVAGERLLVCVGPDALSERVVRAARRLALAHHAQWLAVYVETPSLQRLPQEARDRVLRTLKLAGQLGAQTENLSGDSVAAELIALANARNISKIAVGKPLQPRWRDRFKRSLVDELIRGSGAIDVYVISGEEGEASVSPPRIPARSSPWPAYARALAVVAVATLVCLPLASRIDRINLVMVYLLATAITAWRFGRGPSIASAVLGVLLFDFMFVPPYYSFTFSDTQYTITFAVMLVIGLIISSLTAFGRRQASVARHRERRTAELYALSRELAASRHVDELTAILVRHVAATMDCEAAVLLPDGERHIQDPTHFCSRGQVRPQGSLNRLPVPGNELGIAQYSFDHQDMAGLNTGTLAGADAIYLPLKALHRCVGVLGVRPHDLRQLQIPEQMQLLEAFTSQAAVAMERVQLAHATQAASVEIESERMRNVLLSSISHDFRTPLATIIGSASTLLDGEVQLDESRRHALLGGVLDEARRMNRLVGDLLDLTRLSSGKIMLKRDWVSIEELVGAVLARLDEALSGRVVALAIASDLPLVACDEVLVAQVLVNLVENAIKHTPPGTAIDIGAEAGEGGLRVGVRDHGPGLPAGEETRVFEKFHRIRVEEAQSGFGLGLTICKYIVEAHGGTIAAANHPGGGAEFRFTLPLSASAGEQVP
ncbi:MAG TPA: sensor histidine kinase KdpD [Xanthomonadaceae bacterium]|jgi:two-component system sensor histidine kinase KdpD